ncbi:hypothetical protein J8273_6494 [Carpediemonas membranifera]|uniref:SnoaL-like domain-containing protein n=1 Tax=Carpediemonas membranifera TaxID=201153 RepID=A0A8J6E061_9EUKA|nr:hypothetical protein J8273_6494 [Carpediemonas membranifera]|eukprot:KAG9391718.1 hypothetical protein J8273_6494 [Carpediemonas membranifera]
MPRSPCMASVANPVESLKKYIDAFNNEDIDYIKSQLDENITVFFNGAEAAKGRDTILPSYKTDFENKKKVKIHRGPFLVENGTAADVGLTAITPGQPTVTLDCVYTYAEDPMRQIKHSITNVREVKAE